MGSSRAMRRVRGVNLGGHFADVAIGHRGRTRSDGVSAGGPDG